MERRELAFREYESEPERRPSACGDRTGGDFGVLATLIPVEELAVDTLRVSGEATGEAETAARGV